MTLGNGRTIAGMMPQTARALLQVAFPLLLVACSAACLLEEAQAKDPAAGPAQPIAGRGAVNPAAPIIPGEVVAALQAGDHEGASTALAKLRENAKDRDERAYLGYLQGVAERLAGHKEAARASTSSRGRRESGWPLASQDPLRAGVHRTGGGKPVRGRGTGSIRGDPPTVRRSQRPPRRGLSRLRTATARAR